jgi:hypothetical protein
MEPIILDYDERGYKDFLHKVEKARDHVQNFIDQVHGVCKFDITDTELKDVLFSSQSELMAAAIEKTVLTELDKAGITSDTIRSSTVKGDLEKYYNLFNQFQKPDSEFSLYLTIENGKVKADEKAIRQKEESFRRAILTEAGKALYEAHLRMIQAMNDFVGLCTTRKANIVRDAFTVNKEANKIIMEDSLPWHRIDYDKVAELGGKPL